MKRRPQGKRVESDDTLAFGRADFMRLGTEWKIHPIFPRRTQTSDVILIRDFR